MKKAYKDRDVDQFIAETTPTIEADEKVDEGELFVRVKSNPLESEHLSVEPYSYWKSVWKLFIRKPSAIFSVVLIVLLVLGAIIFPLIAPADAFQSNLELLQRPIRFSSKYLFGTDSLGRNLFYCCWRGLRKSLILSLICTSISTLIGIIVGLLWGYIKWLDKFMIEFYNFIMNIPSLLLYMLLGFILAAAAKYDNEGHLVFSISAEVRLCISLTIFDWLGTARFIRNQTLIINDREYNVASQTLGTPGGRIMTHNLLPYLMAIIATNASLTIPSMISGEVALSYFGLGLPSGTISIGAQIQDGIQYFGTYSWQLLWPAFILGLVVLGFYLLGVSLSDSMDPKKHR